MNIKKLLKERGIKIIYKNHFDKELKRKIIITGASFTKDFLLNRGFNEIYPISEASVREVEKIKKLIKNKEKKEELKEIVGFGGGKAIDVAKKISFDLNLDLILVPTAPSHDGFISKNCSLYYENRRETIPAKYPKKVVIPLSLWKKSKNLKKAGICDILSNLIALQDLSLAESKGEKFSEFYKELSFEAVRKVIDSKNEKDLSEALILSGLAMEETSRYCSGSEHDIERLLENKMRGYLHGQLAGTGTLISAKVYSIYHKKLPKLRFNPETLFEDIKDKMTKVKVYDFALEPLLDRNFKPTILKDVSKVRPERYNLWNFIDSKKVNWNKVIKEIIKE